MTTTTPMPRLLRLPQVIELTGISRDTVYRLGAAGKFPRPRKLGDRASAWREDEVRAWIESRPVVMTTTGQAERKGDAA